MARYSLVPEARDDLTNIFDHIARDSIDAALQVHDRFIEILISIRRMLPS